MCCEGGRRRTAAGAGSKTRKTMLQVRVCSHVTLSPSLHTFMLLCMYVHVRVCACVRLCLCACAHVCVGCSPQKTHAPARHARVHQSPQAHKTQSLHCLRVPTPVLRPHSHALLSTPSSCNCKLTLQPHAFQPASHTTMLSLFPRALLNAPSPCNPACASSLACTAFCLVCCVRTASCAVHGVTPS